jgi:hypothetical protein
VSERPDIGIRAYEPDRDGSFVRAAWIRSFESSPVAGSLGAHYLGRWTDVVDNLLARRTALVATSPDAPDLLLGFVCGDSEQGVIDFAFTKDRFRRNGVARALIKDLFPSGIPTMIYYTHQTGCSRDYARIHQGYRYDLTRIWLGAEHGA